MLEFRVCLFPKSMSSHLPFGFPYGPDVPWFPADSFCWMRMRPGAVGKGDCRES